MRDAKKKEAHSEKRTWPAFASWVSQWAQAIEEDGASKHSALPSGLYVVSTPIGNLGDITLRALWTLRAVDAVLCEDTRVTGKLLTLYGIKKPLISCHDHNEESRIADVLDKLERGQTLALVSDAGTPMIADPGFRLARACRKAGHPVVAIPGANALLAALTVSGLPTDSFLFSGFLPPKSAARKKALESLKTASPTLAFYESPQRIAAALADMRDVLGPERMGAIIREITKMHEEVRTDSLAALADFYEKAETPKGEIVLLVAPDETQAVFKNWEDILREHLKTKSLSDAVAETATMTGMSKRVLYARALLLKEPSSDVTQ